MRLWLLTALTLCLPQLAWAQADAGPALDEARRVMKQGLEREVPGPSSHGKSDWPRPAETRAGPQQGSRAEPGARGAEVSERVRNEASVRARAAAEERRAESDDQPGVGVGQSRTRAAKAVGPKPKPPKP